MKKVKEMAVCMKKGKVCVRAKSAYNQLIEVTSSINALEAEEQSDTVAYEVLHASMTAVKNELIKQVHETCLDCEIDIAKKEVRKAEKAIRDARRAQNHAYDDVWYRLRADNKHLEPSKLYNLGSDVRLTDPDCIAAKEALDATYKARNIAAELLRNKQDMLNRLYPQDTANENAEYKLNKLLEAMTYAFK
jgi:hypothetical protein